MGNLILIDEDDLRGLINEAVTNVTKKIASKAAVLSYKNQIFNPPKPRRRTIAHYDEPICSCGSGGGCGSNSSYSNSGGGCGGGNTSGGC